MTRSIMLIVAQLVALIATTIFSQQSWAESTLLIFEQLKRTHHCCPSLKPFSDERNMTIYAGGKFVSTHEAVCTDFKNGNNFFGMIYQVGKNLSKEFSCKGKGSDGVSMEGESEGSGAMRTFLRKSGDKYLFQGKGWFLTRTKFGGYETETNHSIEETIKLLIRKERCQVLTYKLVTTHSFQGGTHVETVSVVDTKSTKCKLLVGEQQ